MVIEPDFTLFWDKMEKFETNGLIQRCPECGLDDCKFGLHSRAKCEVSIKCNDCDYLETSMAANCSDMVNKWYGI